jgi:hypothetical protein
MLRHRPRPIGRSARAAVISIAVFLFVVATRASDQAVIWTDILNATAIGNSLQKTSGCDGCEDGGASSQPAISQGDGFVEFTVGEADTFWVGGLSHGDDSTTIADVDFAWRFNGGGWADVLEGGLYQSGGDTPYAAGDVFRVAVVGGKIQYSRNGTLLRESQTAVPQYPLLLDVSLGSLGATVQNARIGVADPPPPLGGFLEKAGSPALRARFTRSQIDAFLPANGARGAFTFPAPYNSKAIRLTNATDCAGGQDCLWYVGYSYWRNINNHAGSNEMLILLGMDRNLGGAGPSVIAVNKLTDQVQNRGPLFDASSPYAYSTGEGWYFSAKNATKLYVYLVGSSKLWRYDVVTRKAETKPALDLTQCKRPSVCPAAAAYIYQPHSSDDDRVHSATVQDSSYSRLGCVVYDSKRFQFHAPRPGNFLDECHVDKSGNWLMLLEGTPSGSVNNRVVDLRKGTITDIDDVQGALGHLDMGYGYAVGADNWNPLPNATILLKFPVTSTQRPIGPVAHFNKRWDIAAANHVAHGNATAGTAAETQYACGSNASRVPDMADEIVCFPLNANRNADGSLDVLVLGQVMTDLDAIGGRDFYGDDYSQLPKGNLDVTGTYFIWTTNMGGDRLDAFLVKVPANLLAR